MSNDNIHTTSAFALSLAGLAAPSSPPPPRRTPRQRTSRFIENFDEPSPLSPSPGTVAYTGRGTKKFAVLKLRLALYDLLPKGNTEKGRNRCLPSVPIRPSTAGTDDEEFLLDEEDFLEMQDTVLPRKWASTGGPGVTAQQIWQSIIETGRKIYRKDDYEKI